MTKTSLFDGPIRRYDWQLSLIVFILVFIRRWFNHLGSHYFLHSVVILILLFISCLAFSWVVNKWKRWIWIYIVFQVILIETLGLLPPPEDTWGLLLFPLWSELKLLCSTRNAYLIGISLGMLMIATLMTTFDWLIGMGYGVFMVATGFLLLSPGIVYEQSETARLESQRLLLELKKAHRQLAKASRQAEELIEIRERARMANELHDSVSQLMFSIKLLAQSTRLMIEKDPAAVPHQLEQLQELTNRALLQMRSLITQWRGET
ncbi:MAG: histidine kinase dimerization/phosphoacceptor domain-containing protein [Anaerolineaceae bacterium]